MRVYSPVNNFLHIMPPSASTPPTRDRLINSARFLFWERGFAGTSMADLLAHAEVNSGSFYHFFESKEALLREVLEGYLVALRPMIVDPAYAQTDEPLARIFAILAGYRDRILATDSKYGCPLGRLALEIDPRIAPRTHSSRRTFRDGSAPFASASNSSSRGSRAAPISTRSRPTCSP